LSIIQKKEGEREKKKDLWIVKMRPLLVFKWDRGAREKRSARIALFLEGKGGREKEY